MESWKPKIHNQNHRPYGRTKANAPCRKHPKHRQSPGVCSICLNEKLSKLTNTSGSSRAKRAAKSMSSSSSSSSSSYISSLSSSNASSYSSPVVNYMGSRARKSMRVFKNSGQEVLKKSRSMAFFLQRRKEEDDQNGKNIEMKRGFWSKLLPRRSKGLMHSNTTTERIITAVH